MLMRFLRLFGFYRDGETLVRVKSWCPSVGEYGLEWPTLLIDRPRGRRQTSTPVWRWKK